MQSHTQAKCSIFKVKTATLATQPWAHEPNLCWLWLSLIHGPYLKLSQPPMCIISGIYEQPALFVMVHICINKSKLPCVLQIELSSLRISFTPYTIPVQETAGVFSTFNNTMQRKLQQMMFEAAFHGYTNALEMLLNQFGVPANSEDQTVSGWINCLCMLTPT